MLVDDEKINCFIAEKLIKGVSENTNVIAYFNGWDALDYLEIIKKTDQRFPDFIFVDLMMRFIDGWEFLDQFQKRILSCVTTKIVILTSSIFHHDIKKAGAHPISNTFISKPLTSENLRDLFSES